MSESIEGNEVQVKAEKEARRAASKPKAPEQQIKLISQRAKERNLVLPTTLVESLEKCANKSQAKRLWKEFLQTNPEPQKGK